MKTAILFSLMFFGISSAFAQQYDELQNHRRTSDTTIYYVGINSTFGDSQQIAFHGGKIGVLFEDKFGVNDSVAVEVIRASDQSQSTFGFVKKFGTNTFILEQLDLNSLDSMASYTLSLTDDMGKKYQKNLVINPVREEIPIAATIIKTPIVIDCNNPVNTRIEFFSDVKGGKAPYLVEWDFLGDSDSLQEVIPIQGFSSAILVDLPPPYFIGLKITDSCGEVSFQSVQVACDTSRPNYNSILFSIDPSKKRTIEK